MLPTMQLTPRGFSVPLCALLLGLLGVEDAGAWNQWRGPTRDGQAVAAGQPAAWLPAAWPAQLTLVWRTEVGLGHASPVTTDERVFVHSRSGEDEVVQAMDLTTGRTLWRQSYPVPYTRNPAAVSHDKGPKSTPLVADGRVFTVGITGILSAFAADSGKLLWRKDGSEFAKTYPLYGAATSPLLADGLLVVHLGGHHQGALLALDPPSGEVKWRLSGDGPAYASPILATLAGQKQIVTQTDQRILGVDPQRGSVLWSLPFTTDWDQNIITPLAVGERLIFSGTGKGFFAVEVTRQGDALTPKTVWQNDQISAYMSTPVLSHGRLFGMAEQRKGQFFALNPQTGALLWTHDGRGGENAALIAAGDFVLLLNERAELWVLPAQAASFAPVAQYQAATSPTWAHPALTAHGLLIKDAESLTLWQWRGPSAPKPAAAPPAGSRP